MCLQPNKEIGNEVRGGLDQFFRIDEGFAKFLFNGRTQYVVKDGEAVVDPAGSYHNEINPSSDKPLKLRNLQSTASS